MLERTSTPEGLTWLRMDHGKVNAMDLEFCDALTRSLHELRHDDTRAVILTGNERVFSAGVDLVRLLKEIDCGSNEYLPSFLRSLTGCFRAIFAFPKPMVAAINGHAIAGGCILAAACDQRQIQPRARIGLPELRVGVPLPSIAIETMRYAATPQALQEMVYAGQNYRGQEAVHVGLADVVVPAGELANAAERAAKQLLSIPSSVFAITKSQLRGPFMAQASHHEAAMESSIVSLWRSATVQHAIREYVAKRL